jgi:hypothetical protein
MATRPRRDEGPQDDEIRARRVRPRRSGGGFSNSGLTDAEGTPRDINADVVAAATAPPVSIPTNPNATLPPDADPTGSNTEEFNPVGRLAQVRRRAGEYEREYRLQLLHRLLLRRIPLDEIASQLQVSVPQIIRDRKELMERLRQEARDLDIDLIVGNAKGFYEEIAAMAARAASNANTPIPMRLAAMRTSLAAENDKHRFFQAAGVYDVLRYKRAKGSGVNSDLARLMELTEQLLQEDDGSPTPEQNPLGEFSGGDAEVLDL